MKQLVLDFAHLLRQAGIGITTTEILDCLQACQLFNFTPSSLRSCMELTLVKSDSERPVFHTLFDLYFLEMSPAVPSPDHNPALPASVADGSGRGTAGAGGGSDNLPAAIDGLPPAALEDLARSLTAAISLHNGNAPELALCLRQIQIDLRWFEMINTLELRRQKGLLDEATFQRQLAACIRFQTALMAEMQKLAVTRFGHKALLSVIEHANLRRRDFQYLAADELQNVEKEVAKLARRLANRPGIRKKPSLYGQIDLRRTLQAVIKTGGYPLRLQYRGKVKSKVNLWLLCDVSNSVERYSRFMLQLVQAAQQRYATVRSFVFVDQLLDVTAWFRNGEVEEFLASRALRDQFSRGGLSRYDRVFEQFTRYELSAMSEKTKLIVLGDARNNWQPGGSEELAQIAARTDFIYWLNPLPQEDWRKNDCLMAEYAPHCRQIFECRNLEQLTQIAQAIL